jgi:hypothetical protein
MACTQFEHPNHSGNSDFHATSAIRNTPNPRKCRVVKERACRADNQKSMPKTENLRKSRQQKIPCHNPKFTATFSQNLYPTLGLHILHKSPYHFLEGVGVSNVVSTDSGRYLVDMKIIWRREAANDPG